MSPFSHLLQKLRLQHQVRQADLAALLGYEQSYISALEIGTKGPPPDEFIERLIAALELSIGNQQQLREAVAASQRNFSIEPDAPEDLFLLLRDLREKVKALN
jgi:transcriptional regulator with XRE-family HTH domain